MNKIIKKLKNDFKLIDFIGVILFFLILVLALLFFLRKPSYTYVTLQIAKDDGAYYNFWYYKPSDWYIENLKIGMSDVNLLGKKNMELVDVHYYPVKDAAEESVFVVLKINAVFNKRNNQYSHQGKPLLIGDHRVFKLGKVSIPGLIRNIDANLEPKKIKKAFIKGVFNSEDNENLSQDAEMRFIGIKNYKADKIYEGLASFDSKGEEIIKVTRVEKTSGYREFIYKNSINKVIDSERKIVDFEAEITLTEVNGNYLYMEEVPLSLGRKILFSIENLDLYFVVEDIAF